MKRFIALLTLTLVLCSHDMFLKMDSFFLPSNSEVTLQLFNGTFDESDNVITRDRMIDVSLIQNGSRIVLDTSAWHDIDKTSHLDITTQDEGTYVLGVSTQARNIELAAEDFNNYLEHDGVLDVLDERKEAGILGENAVEKYSKHVKTIFQVGETKSNDWQTSLGYPIEFIPLVNPYDLSIGDRLPLTLLRDGKPLSNQLVYAGFSDGSTSHGHTHNEDGDSAEEAHHHDEQQLRTDENGVVDVHVDHGGQWYVRTIHMETLADTLLTHESNWATLTFEMEGSGHGTSSLIFYLTIMTIIILIVIAFQKLRKNKNAE